MLQPECCHAQGYNRRPYALAEQSKDQSVLGLSWKLGDKIHIRTLQKMKKQLVKRHGFTHRSAVSSRLSHMALSQNLLQILLNQTSLDIIETNSEEHNSGGDKADNGQSLHFHIL